MRANWVLDFLTKGKMVATSVPASCVENLAWIGIYPLDLSKTSTRTFLKNHGLQIFPRSGLAYHIRSFEVPKNLIDADASIAEREMVSKRSTFAFGPDDLRAKLDELEVEIDSLEAPFKSNYPI